MSRVVLSVVVAALAGVSLTGCSSAVSSNSSAEQLQALKFESDPPGAEIHTTDQTCKTPCELSVPSREQLVTITKNGYQLQTAVRRGRLCSGRVSGKPSALRSLSSKSNSVLGASGLVWGSI